MIKNCFIYFFTIICAIIAVSCSRDDVEVVSSECIPVSFNINFEESVTRAISDGTSVDQLMYAVFNERGEVVIKKSIKRDVPEVFFKNDKNADMTISMPIGSNYKAVFWAQNSECEAYEVSDDMIVTVDYDGANNDELRDAFFGVSDPFNVNANKVVNVTLKRPFAQVNAGAFPFDWEFATELYDPVFEATKSAAIIRNVPDEINLLNGEVSGSVNAIFESAAMPAERLYADVDENGRDEEYVYLSMSYVLASDEPTEHSVDFFFLDDNDKAVMFNNRFGEIPLQRNCTANYVGQILTDSGELNVRDYESSDYVKYNVAEATTYENAIYNLTSHYSSGAIFGSENGQLVTMDNVVFTGDTWVIELGGYRGPGYVKYNNELNNVIVKDLSVSSNVEVHEWYFSPAIIAYGKSIFNDCEMSGTTTVAKPIVDKHGITQEFTPVDLGVRNESDAVINGGRYGSILAWTHAVVDIKGAEVGTLYCGTCDSTPHSQMTIHSGTKIDKIINIEPRCPYGSKEYSTRMTIKSGAEIGSLQLVSTDVEFLIIESGAKVGKITCEGIEYTYEELRDAMGLD